MTSFLRIISEWFQQHPSVEAWQPAGVRLNIDCPSLIMMARFLRFVD
jgi:hypothetical protein